jgi:hypothetical protein
LEELEMVVEIDASDAPDKASFVITGLVLECAMFSNKCLALSDEILQQLPKTHFKWLRRTAEMGKADTTGLVTLPVCTGHSTRVHIPRLTFLLPLQVYLNANRSEVLFTIDLAKPAGIPDYVWDERGTCVRAWEGTA